MSDPNTTPTADHHAPGEIESPDWKSTWCVLVVQAQNAFNDKFAQFALLGLAGVLLPNLKEVYPHIVSMLLVIPFVALAPVAGWTSDRFSKRAVIFACLIAQIAILAGIAVSVWAGSLYVATAWFFLLAVQSTFFSPAKMGILKELVGSKKLAEVSGWMQMLTIIAIILGTVAGGQAFDRLAGNQTEVAAAVPPALEHSAPVPSATSASAGEAATLPPPSPEKAERSSKAAAISVGGILFFAFIALAVVRPVKRTEPHPTEKFTARLLGRHFVHLREVWRDAPLRRCAAGITFFWFSGGTIALILIEAGKIVAGGEAGSTSASGIMLACSGGGVALGSLLTSWISRNSIELGIVPIGGAGMALGLLAAVFAAPTDPSSPAAFYVALTLIGIFSAMFLVPLYAYVQDRSDPARRGRILSAINLLDTLGGVIAVGAQLLMMKLKMPIAYQFAFLFALALFASIYVFRLLPQNAVRFALLLVFRVIYRVSARGTGNLPAQGGALLIANHVSFVDAFAISAASDRPIRFVIFDTYYQNPIFRPFLRLFGAVPISPTRAKDAINATADAVKAGDLVCIFPEGQLTRTGCVNEIRRGFELIARAAGHPVIPVYMDGLWGSVFSFERGRFFWKVPRGIPYRVSVAFGEPMAAREATAAKAREAIEWLGADLFAGRPAFQKPLARALVESLSRRTWKACAIDLGSKSGIARGWGRGATLTAASLLADRWRREGGPGERIGIILPPGTTCFFASLALVLAGKVPVFLPVGGPALTADGLKLHGIRRLLTARPIAEMLPNFPEGFAHTYVEEELGKLGPGPILRRRALIAFCPTALLRRLLRAPRADAENGAWGFAGATGEFRFMSGAATLANAAQIAEFALFSPGDRLLPLVRPDLPGGAMLGIWFPLLHGVNTALPPALIDADVVRRMLAACDPTVVAGDATGARLLACAEGVGSPRAFLAFGDLGDADAERELRDSLGEIGCALAPAFPDPETGALLALSMPHPVTPTGADPQIGWREGTRGRLLPGFAFSQSDGGTAGFYGGPLGDDWVRVGDLGGRDADGFVTPSAPAD